MINTKNYSVLMAVYYKEKPENLVASIDSMMNQTLRPSEIIIVKDGPLTPELDDRIEEYIRQYDQLFSIVKIIERKGLGYALKVGIEQCKYELIARMDSDDISLPERCERQINMINGNPNLSIVGSNIAEFNDSTENITAYRTVPENHEEIVNFAKKRSPFNHPTVLFKKSAVLECGNYREWPKCQDYDLFVRLLSSGYRGYNLQENLLYMRADSLYNKRKSKSRKSALEAGISKWYDFLFSVIAQTILYILPAQLTQGIYYKFLRKDCR
jgi:glycosyltransferase involved in cell wall biosynthesis